MSAMECSKPLKINAGMHSKMPSGVLLSRKMLTARYISTPQNRPRVRVDRALCSSFARHRALALWPRFGISARISQPHSTVPMRFPKSPSSSAEMAALSCFSGM